MACPVKCGGIAPLRAVPAKTDICVASNSSSVVCLMSTPSVDECVSDIHRTAEGVGTQLFSIRFHAANCLACH